MPTVIVGQNGAKVTQKTRIRVAHCPIEIIHHKLARHHARITVMTPSAGKVITSGKYLQKVHKKVGTARRVDIKAKLDRRGRRLLHARHHLKVRVHVRFIPAASHRKHHHASKKALKLTFRR